MCFSCKEVGGVRGRGFGTSGGVGGLKKVVIIDFHSLERKRNLFYYSGNN